MEERDGSADGFAWSARLAEKVRALDPTRPVSASACALFSEYGQRPAGGTTGNQALNMAYDGFAEGRDIWGPGTEGYFAPLDVAGYNYKSVRYAYDKERFPNRVIYGSESYPRDAFQTWKNTVENPTVIGDFVWTAWDYLGEVGVGRWDVSDSSRPGDPAWPWMTAACSDFDLIGGKRPQSFYRDMVWGVGAGPHLFCLPPELTGKNIARLSWGWLPVERNYTYPGREGQDMEIHVYARADEVELLQNGVSLGCKPCEEEEQWQAVFTVPYAPGTLEAVAYEAGREIGRDALSTTGPAVKLTLTAENAPQADGRDLCFVSIQAVDEHGQAAYNENGAVTAQFGGQPFTLPVGFAPAEAAENVYVGEPAPCGALDLTLGALMENEKALTVLKSALGPFLDNPMLSAMKRMPLGRLLAMGGQSLPPQALEALDNALK